MKACQDTETHGEVKVKQEHVDAIRRYPSEPGDTKRLCKYCGLDYKVPSVCPAQGNVCSKCRKSNHFAIVYRSPEEVKGREHHLPRRPVVRQIYDTNETWEHELIRDLPRLEDTDDEGVFIASCAGSRKAERRPPPMGNIDIKGTAVLALIDKEATVSVMDPSMLDKLKICPIVRQTNTKMYSYVGTTPLAVRGVGDVTVRSGQVRTTFHVTEEKTNHIGVQNC